MKKKNPFPNSTSSVFVWCSARMALVALEREEKVTKAQPTVKNEIH